MFKNHISSTDLTNFTLKTLEIEINRDCNMSCEYCFRSFNSKDYDSSKKFTRWNDLYTFLKNINISNEITVGFCTGEFFTESNIDILYKAIKTVNKIRRIRDVDITYRVYTNATNPSIILDFLRNMLDENIIVSISFDDIKSKRYYPKDVDIESNLKILASSEFGDKLIVRSAIYDYAFDMSMIWLYDIGFRNIEYYLLNDNSVYSTDGFVDRFKIRMTNLITFFKDKDVLYNIHKFNTNMHARSQCNSGTLVIGNDGTVSTCQFIIGSPNVDDAKVSCDLLDDASIYTDIYRNFNNDYVLDRSDWECKTCRNILCEECCSYKPICKPEDVESRKYQQCKLRDIEMEVYESILGKREDV